MRVSLLFFGLSNRRNYLTLIFKPRMTLPAGKRGSSVQGIDISKWGLENKDGWRRDCALNLSVQPDNPYPWSPAMSPYRFT
jgi:hypothetical protein